VLLKSHTKMGNDESSPTVSPPTLSSPSLSAVAKYITSGRARKILVLTGAGISTSAGIPDFRSPETGLYANLARLNLPYAEAVFDLSYFRENPEPFWTLARELFYPDEIYNGSSSGSNNDHPSQQQQDENHDHQTTPKKETTTSENNPKTRFRPTLTHSFLSLLHQKNLLLRVITQNIDGLERAAGVPEAKLIEAHGTFSTQRCIDCKSLQSDAELYSSLRRGAIPRCEICETKGLVKPDIVFFGEALPAKFFAARGEVAEADLVMILGTSLTVYPFAALPRLVGREVPRVLINRDVVGDLGSGRDDVLVLGECDEGVRRLCDALGWREEVEGLWRGTEGMGGAEEEKEREGEGDGERREISADERLEEEVRLLTREVDKTLGLSREHAERVRRDAAKDGAATANLDHVFVGRNGRSLSKV
jgi:NAD-dependent histone deacetylase SIR2